jgi:hypothetical protein
MDGDARNTEIGPVSCTCNRLLTKIASQHAWTLLTRAFQPKEEKLIEQWTVQIRVPFPYSFAFFGQIVTSLLLNRRSPSLSKDSSLKIFQPPNRLSLRTNLKRLYLHIRPNFERSSRFGPGTGL